MVQLDAALTRFSQRTIEPTELPRVIVPVEAPKTMADVPVMVPPTEVGLTVIVVVEVFTVPQDPLVMAQ